MRKLAGLLMLLCLLCTPRHIYIDRNYTPHFNITVSFIPLTPEGIRHYSPKQIEKAFKEDNRGASSIIADSGNNRIKRALADSLKGVLFSYRTRFDSLQLSVQDDRYFKVVPRKVGKDSLKMVFRVPRKDVFDTLDPGVSVYFVITSVHFEKNPKMLFTLNRQESSSDELCVIYQNSRLNSVNEEGMTTLTGNSFPLGPSFKPPFQPNIPAYPWTGQSEEVYVKVRFVVWDKNRDALVSCGEFVKSMGSAYSISKGAWLRLFESIGYTMAANSPFAEFKIHTDQKKD